MPDSREPQPFDSETPDTTPPATPRSDRRVEEASVESFPASDPPAYMGARAAKGGSSATSSGGTEQADPIRQWALTLVRALDEEQVEAVTSVLTEDAAVRVGAGPPLVGRDAVATWLHAWFERVGPCTRHVTDVRQADDALFIELDVRGSTADGMSTAWPEAISVRLRQAPALADRPPEPPRASRVTVYGAGPTSWSADH